jgi:hypothetical protein
LKILELYFKNGLQLRAVPRALNAAVKTGHLQIVKCLLKTYLGHESLDDLDGNPANTVLWDAFEGGNHLILSARSIPTTLFNCTHNPNTVFPSGQSGQVWPSAGPIFAKGGYENLHLTGPQICESSSGWTIYIYR